MITQAIVVILAFQLNFNFICASTNWWIYGSTMDYGTNDNNRELIRREKDARPLTI